MKDKIPVKSNTRKMHATRPSESRRPVVAIRLAEFISLLSNRQHKVLGNLRTHADKTFEINTRVSLLPQTHRGKRKLFCDKSFQDQLSSRRVSLPPCQSRHLHVRAREHGAGFTPPPAHCTLFFPSSSSGPLAPRGVPSPSLVVALVSRLVGFGTEPVCFAPILGMVSRTFFLLFPVWVWCPAHLPPPPPAQLVPGGKRARDGSQRERKEREQEQDTKR